MFRRYFVTFTTNFLQRQPTSDQRFMVCQTNFRLTGMWNRAQNGGPARPTERVSAYMHRSVPMHTIVSYRYNLLHLLHIHTHPSSNSVAAVRYMFSVSKVLFHFSNGKPTKAYHQS